MILRQFLEGELLSKEQPLCIYKGRENDPVSKAIPSKRNDFLGLARKETILLTAVKAQDPAGTVSRHGGDRLLLC